MTLTDIMSGQVIRPIPRYLTVQADIGLPIDHFSVTASVWCYSFFNVQAFQQL